jgi:hypothetical protein
MCVLDDALGVPEVQVKQHFSKNPGRLWTRGDDFPIRPSTEWWGDESIRLNPSYVQSLMACWPDWEDGRER